MRDDGYIFQPVLRSDTCGYNEGNRDECAARPLHKGG